MLKFYAKITELNERDVSETTLKRLRVMSFLSLPFTPLLGVMEADILTNSALIGLMGFILLMSAVALFILCISKLVNRVWVRDKYLDEWELGMKHRSMAFAFQVVLYAICVVLFGGVILDCFYGLTLPKITPEIIGYSLFSIMMLGLYAQIYTQFAMVEPIEEDEFSTDIDARRSLKGVITISSLLVVGIVVIPFILGVISGIKNPAQSEIAILAYEAKDICEARGSRVHWVSVDEDNYGFACFDENRPYPPELELGEEGAE